MKVELCYATVATMQVEVDDKFKKLKCSGDWTPELEGLAAELEAILSKASDTDTIHFYGIFDTEDDVVMLEY